MLDTYKKNLSMKLKRLGKSLGRLINPIKVVIIVYSAIALCIASTYYYAWLIMWFAGKEGLTSLLSLFKEFTSPAAIGFITFVALSMVDSDGDGIPDSIDKIDDRKKDEDEKEPPRRGFRGGDTK